MKVLNVYYDLRIAPLSFDFVHFLAIACAEAERTESRIALTLFHPTFRNSNAIEQNYPPGYHAWKLNNVLIRTAQLCPWVVEIISNGSNIVKFDPPFYPADYHPVTANLNSGLTPLPITHHQLDAAMMTMKDRVILRSSEYANAWYRRKFGDQTVVALNIRTTPHNAPRNAPMSMWYNVYRRLMSAGYTCIVIPDQDDFLDTRSYSQFDWRVAEDACMDLDLRIALYRNALATLNWSSGTGSMLSVCGAAFTTYAIWNEANGVASKDMFARKGPHFGVQPPWLDPLLQRYDWRPAGAVTEEYIMESAMPWLQQLKDRALQSPI